MLHRAVDIDLVEPAHDAVFQAVAKSCQVLGFLGHFFPGKLARFSQTDNAGNIQRAGTHATLVTTTINDR